MHPCHFLLLLLAKDIGYFERMQESLPEMETETVLLK